MLTDSTPQSIVAWANLNNFSTEEKTRRELALHNKDFYYSKQEGYVQVLNADMSPVTVNLTMPIIKKKVSLLYSRTLIREYDGPEASIAFLEALYDAMKIDNFLQKVDLASELTGTGLIYVGIDEQGNPYLRMYDASAFSPVGNEDSANEIADAISLITLITSVSKDLRNPEVSRKIKSEIWTNNIISTYVDGKPTATVENPLGYLPFVNFKGEEVYNQYLGNAPANSIVLLNKYINQMLSELGYMVKMQSGTPVVLSGFQSGEAIIIHPGKAITVPAGASAVALQLNPKLIETLDIIKFLEDKIYNVGGVPKVSIIGDETATSGKELQIKWSPLTQVFKDKALRFNNYELGLANMILKVMGMEPILGISVRYPEEAVLPLQNDVAEILTEIQLGLATPIDAMLVKQPTLNETEAEALVRANIDFNNEVLGQQPTEAQVAPVDETQQ